MAGTTIEARGYDETMELFRFHTQNNGTAIFSVWCGKDLRFPFKENDQEAAENMLSEHLRFLERARAAAIYSIRCHPELDKNGSITNNTAYTSSFNFKIYDTSNYSPGLQPYQPAPNDVSRQMLDLMTKMDTRIAALEQNGIGSDSETSQEDFILSLMDNPLTQMIAGVVVDKMFPGNNHTTTMFNNNNRSAGIAGVDQNQEINIADQEKKCQSAVVRLFAVDPLIGDHLLKLAAMAEKNPAKYKMALALL